MIYDMSTYILKILSVCFQLNYICQIHLKQRIYHGIQAIA